MDFQNMTEEQLAQYDWGNSDIEYENIDESDNESINSYISVKNKKESPKLEKLEPISDNILLSKFTELTKIFYSTVKSSNWSEEIKNKMKNSYKKIDNELQKQLNIKKDNKKKCDNSNCSCTDCQPTKKRWTAKKMLLTIPYTSASKEEILKYYKNKYNLCKIGIAQENHKNSVQNTILTYIYIYISNGQLKRISRIQLI